MQRTHRVAKVIAACQRLAEPCQSTGLRSAIAPSYRAHRFMHPFGARLLSTALDHASQRGLCRRASRRHCQPNCCRSCHTRPPLLLRCRPRAAWPASICSRTRVACRAAKPQEQLTGIVFDAEEVKGELATVGQAPIDQSYARVDFHPESEAGKTGAPRG